jgi:hypothetical protein
VVVYEHVPLAAVFSDPYTHDVALYTDTSTG